MSSTFRVACIQTNTQNDMAANIDAALVGIRAAHAAGAEFVTTPENVVMMGASGRETLAMARPEDDHPALKAFSDVARECGLWVLVGSLGIALDSGMIANRSFLISAAGKVVARYDKIHMFDVELPNGETYRESARFEPGSEAVLAESPFGQIGVTVCYDLRFPHLYRALAHGGARILTVPSAFTKVTGEAHWHVLLRARAIETGCYVIAPAQTGSHPGKRQTYGHSLVVSPWGEVLADGGESPGIITADLDIAEVGKARSQIPALDHDREITVPPKLVTDVKGAA